jgi:16S rRNA (cytosine1402-N4)-methyltransferase
MTTPVVHRPVLLKEAMAALAPRKDGRYVDGTFGAGGYSRAILRLADCELVAIDRDPDAIARGRTLEREFPRLRLVQGRFGDLDLHTDRADGVVLDLGVSSPQIDEAGRGFSFQADAPLDMRMSKLGPTAADAVNCLGEAELAELIFAYGEESESRRIARAIVQARAGGPITRTGALASLIERAVGGRKGARLHPATRTFQALRMLVNDELGELARALEAAERVLSPDGRLVVVAFHSLEDRLVKSFLYERAGYGSRGSRHAPEIPAAKPQTFRLEQRRTVTPGEAEIASNPRARSASLRWAIRTDKPAWDETPVVDLAPKALKEWSRIA